MKRRLNNIQEYSVYLGLPNDMYSPALMRGNNKVPDVPKSYAMRDIRAKPTNCRINSSECCVSEELSATEVQQSIEPVYDPSTVN